MPRYYFHVLNGKNFIDDVGTEADDIEALKAEAVAFAGGILKSERPTDMWRGIAWQMRVTDSPVPDGGQTHLTLSVTATASE
ncbi:DUF6894 family protein [Bradyrhizobium japonicum]|uniref:DUF6894 family protein n=1 Tax=Bradyrhizobium japonicum TaxID=375 RepID=UPI002714DD6E|nr:hypothetical protein [Bradyrhizobium japonicum]WLB54825.1 hypothetical protein QIH94_02205 [Bradyrhizobium japonicum]WLB63300.1 hypothetical protein QIH96_43680 [Bradyrhizobium japonicum]